MRRLLILSLIIIATLSGCHKKISYKIIKPESVVWNPLTKTYLISNAGTGYILSLKDKYEFFVFNKKPLSSPKGMAIQGKTLYVADRTYLDGFDLQTGKRTYHFEVPDAIFLNDVATSPDGMVYVSDMERNCIFFINPATDKVDIYSNKNLTKPNGLYYFTRGEEPFLAYVCFKDKSVLEIINLKTKSLESVLNTEMPFADGITRESDGSWLISSWADSTVWRFSADFNQRSRLAEKYDSPADIFYSLENKELAIPSFNGNTVTFVTKVDTTAAKSKPQK